MTPRLRALNFFLRHIEKRHLQSADDIIALRRRFSRQARLLFANPPYAAYVNESLSRDLPVTWVSAGVVKNDGVMLYLHGGSYAIGNPATHQAMLARLCAMTGMRAVLPDYRKSPEHPFPAGLEDARRVYETLLSRGYSPDRVVFGGDSAGGGLMLGLLHLVRQEHMPLPAGVFAFSPWTDLALGGDSLAFNAVRDPFLPVTRSSELARIYLDGAAPLNPLASPLYGDFRGVNPVLIQVGDTEILLDDSRRLTERLKAQGVSAQLEVWPDVPHVWQIFQGHLREADEALQNVAAFIGGICPRSR